MALHVYEEQCESFQPPDLEHKLQSLVEVREPGLLSDSTQAQA